MDISIILVFVSVFLVSLIWLSRRKNLPPGRFTIPYIGTIGLLRQLPGRHVHEVFHDETKQYGNIFKFSVGKQLVVVLNEHGLIHEAFVKNAEFCSGRMKGLKRLLNMSPGEDGFALTDYGPTWRELRRFTIQALRDFGVGKTSIEEKIHAELNIMTSVLNGTKGKPTTFLPQIRRLVGNVIFGVIFGKRFEFDDPYFDNLIDMTDEFVKKNGLLEGNMFRIINDLFVAGSETTSTTLDWAILFISEHPNVQKKCQEEIQAVFGDKTLQYADRDQLHYTNATLLEVQRLGNIAPISVPHETSKDIEVGGYTIPANTMVVSNLYAATMDENLFPNPRKFNPERFLDANGKLTKTDTIMPFSVGPRMCAGEMLAKMEMFVVFTNLLQRFTFLPAAKTKHSLEAQLGRIAQTAVPYQVRAQIRA